MKRPRRPGVSRGRSLRRLSPGWMWLWFRTKEMMPPLSNPPADHLFGCAGRGGKRTVVPELGDLLSQLGLELPRRVGCDDTQRPLGTAGAQHSFNGALLQQPKDWRETARGPSVQVHCGPLASTAAVRHCSSKALRLMRPVKPSESIKGGNRKLPPAPPPQPLAARNHGRAAF